MFWLFDSRNRPTGQMGRKLYRLPESVESLRAIWTHVIDAEKVTDPGERQAYLAYAHDYDGDMDEATVVFNDFWACYGWCLGGPPGLDDDDATVPHDATDMLPDEKALAEFTRKGVHQGA